MVSEKIKISLKSINDELQLIENRREQLIKESRDIIILCSQSIISLHQGHIQESQLKLDKAKDLYFSLKTLAQTDLLRYLSMSEQELVECSLLMSIVKNEALPGLDEIGVSSQAYLFGILDCIGEIKRMVYDMVRLDRYDQAEYLFTVMQEIYSEIYPFSIYDNIVSGIRKKLDICKILIENTRELITEEARRSIIIESLKKLDSSL
ncbi:MAG TPA: RNA-binding protein [Nitrososphaeraceae archaeon]|jgi:translin|nr:RNA-binding protein [Nitrososphaeraceae archaeon]MDW3603476.1 RNA-binding protein [Nitrososphaeraceae archaeon]MDW3610512.1 RNA-binding protein [Nitrososphaeraceae archaeon]MDW3625022.1 RNA-binding protein [Nitrososphaeraceae archaeon]MDW3629814.1 RNA-binding protein [Nitrososphaeraceae archaeon]